MNKKRARACIYVIPQQALKYFLSAQVILRLPLFPLLSRWNKLVQTQKEYATLEDSVQFWLSSVRWHYKQKASNLFWKIR